MDTQEVMKRLNAAHDPEHWAFFEELRIGTGMTKDSKQRLDAWAIHYHTSKRNVVRTYELKVSRSDFMHELKDPKKRRAGLRLAHEFYFVTPKDMCKIEEIPVECGLMEVDEDGKMHTTIPAPFRDVEPPTWLFLAAICRRLDKPRLDAYTHYLNEDGKLEMYANAITIALQDHIEKWKNFNQGNKEVPDQIADALTAVYHDALDRVEQNKRIK